jgi:amino acid transporter
MEMPRTPSRPAPAQLSLWDAVSIIIGIIIGAGIYETPPTVLSMVGRPDVALGLWALGGLLCLFGALCYAELASTYPRSGGDYVYLTRAYGPLIGFLFGWAQLAVIQTASIGMMAYVFADYAVKLWDFGPLSPLLYASSAVLILSVMNIAGIVLGKRTQNVLTAAKVLGLGGILLAGFFWPSPGPVTALAPMPEFTTLGLPLVLIFITYGGWNDAAFVVAELRDPRRNIPRALVLGTVGVTAIYLLVNAAYLAGLGFTQAAQSKAIAADVLRGFLGDFGHNAMCVLVMISALGAVNGLIFTSSRVYATLGEDHSVFAGLSRWHPTLGTPLWSLVTQAAISLGMITLVSTTAGQNALNAGLQQLGLSSVSWQGQGGFVTLLRCTAPVFWFFFLLTAGALFVLRINDPDTERPFRVPFYPVIPLIFVLTCAYMVYSGINYAKELGVVGGGLVLAGLPLYWMSRRRVMSEDAWGGKPSA